MFRRPRGEFTLSPVQEPRRLHKAIIQSSGALSLTQTLSKTFFTGVLVEGVTQLQIFISLFPWEQQHSGLIIKQHRSSEFEKVPWFLFWVKDLLFYGFPLSPTTNELNCFIFYLFNCGFMPFQYFGGKSKTWKFFFSCKICTVLLHKPNSPLNTF